MLQVLEVCEAYGDYRPYADRHSKKGHDKIEHTATKYALTAVDPDSQTAENERTDSCHERHQSPVDCDVHFGSRPCLLCFQQLIQQRNEFIAAVGIHLVFI